MTRLWSALELDMVETLTRRVPLLAMEQVEAVWGVDGASLTLVHQAVERLRAGGLCEQTTINAHPRLFPRQPLIRWRPGRTDPDIRQAVQRIRCRWRMPAEPTTVIWASRRAANLFGSTARGLSELWHRDHDLLLADVYVFYRRQHPALARRWAGEHVFPKAGFCLKDPDAFLLGDNGQPVRVIESAGRYGPDQIESFHEHCQEFDLPYELW